MIQSTLFAVVPPHAADGLADGEAAEEPLVAVATVVRGWCRRFSRVRRTAEGREEGLVGMVGEVGVRAGSEMVRVGPAGWCEVDGERGESEDADGGGGCGRGGAEETGVRTESARLPLVSMEVGGGLRGDLERDRKMLSVVTARVMERP
ncbi:hypothetical protein HC762_01675 [bacterium]|nr:hypothetical protein [bacterium]